MILIWRGWGILALLVPVAFMVLVGGLGEQIDKTKATSFAGLGMAIGGIALWFIGSRLNRGRDEAQVAAYRTQRERELRAIVDGGAYEGFGGRRPSSLQEAHAMAARQLDQETALVRNGSRNRNTLFWLPMQWWAPVWSVVGLVLAVSRAQG